jgi:hypothetical protein
MTILGLPLGIWLCTIFTLICLLCMELYLRGY